VSQQTPAESILRVRIYYEDTDAGGVVFYANYLKFFERARTEWLRELGVDQSKLVREHKRMFVVQGLNMAYRRPALLDDFLTIRSRIIRLGRASIHFAQRAERDGELLAEGQIQVCCVDSESMRPAALPDFLRAKLEFTQE
ncbi:putative thioesterase, partial [Bordetella avium 197N]